MLFRSQPVCFLTNLCLIVSLIAGAPSDSPQDADVAQSGYVGGGHNIDPESASQLQYLWNITFRPDEKVKLTAVEFHVYGELTKNIALCQTAGTHSCIRQADHFHCFDREHRPHHRRQHRGDFIRATGSTAMANGGSALRKTKQGHRHYGNTRYISRV